MSLWLLRFDDILSKWKVRGQHFEQNNTVSLRTKNNMIHSRITEDYFGMELFVSLSNGCY